MAANTFAQRGTKGGLFEKEWFRHLDARQEVLRKTESLWSDRSRPPRKPKALPPARARRRAPRWRARARRGVLPAVDAAAPVGDPVARPAPAPGRRRAALGVDVVAARGRVAHQLVGACVQTSRAIRRRGLS